MQKNKLTHFVKPKFVLPPGVEVMTVDYYDTYAKMLNIHKIQSPSEMQMEFCQHFMVTERGKLLAGMSLLSVAIGNSNRLCSSVEFIVSERKGKAGKLLHMLHSNLKKRNGTCYIITQAVQTYSASKFWLKHLCDNTEAMVLSFMIFMLDFRYELHVDVAYLRTKI